MLSGASRPQTYLSTLGGRGFSGSNGCQPVKLFGGRITPSDRARRSTMLSLGIVHGWTMSE